MYVEYITFVFYNDNIWGVKGKRGIKVNMIHLFYLPELPSPDIERGLGG